MAEYRIDPIGRLELLDADPSSSPIRPMAVYVDFNVETGKLDTGMRYQSDNMIPMSVWHGLVRRWTLPLYADGEALTQLVNGGHLDALLTRVRDGAETYLNNQSNWVARLADDAQNAEAEIARLLEGLALEDGGLWAAADYCGESSPTDLGIRAVMSDEEIQRAADALETEASAEDIVLYGTEDYLRERVEALAGDETEDEE